MLNMTREKENEMLRAYGGIFLVQYVFCVLIAIFLLVSGICGYWGMEWAQNIPAFKNLLPEEILRETGWMAMATLLFSLLPLWLWKVISTPIKPIDQN